MKIIVSAKYLRKRLKELDLDIDVKKMEYLIKCEKRNLTVGNLQPIPVESKSDFEYTASNAQLRKLSKVMGIIDDQPVVLTFKDFHWIGIESIVV